MKLRDLTDDEVNELILLCDAKFREFRKTRTLHSRGPIDWYRAGFDAALKARLASEPIKESNPFEGETGSFPGDAIDY